MTYVSDKLLEYERSAPFGTGATADTAGGDNERESADTGSIYPRPDLERLRIAVDRLRVLQVSRRCGGETSRRRATT